MDIIKTNTGYLQKYGGEVAKQATSFATIRSWGDKGKAITHDGLTVERQEYIYVGGYGLVKTIPYELNFVFEDKSRKRGRWSFMCTCGSIAGIVSYNEMKSLMTVQGTEQGFVLACVHHTATKQNLGVGKHADGSSE